MVDLLYKLELEMAIISSNNHFRRSRPLCHYVGKCLEISEADPGTTG